MSSEIATSSPGRDRRARSPASACRAPPRCSRTPATSRPRRPRPAATPRSAMIRPAAMVDLRRDLQRLGEALGARRHDHEVLHVGAAPGMGAAAEDLDLRQRNDRRLVAETDSARAEACGSPPPHAARQRNGGQALPPSRALFGVPSRATSVASIAGLVERVAANERRARSRARSARSAPCTSKPPSRLPPSRLSTASRVPREAPAGATPRPTRAVAERDLRLDRRTAARVPDAARVKRSAMTGSAHARSRSRRSAIVAARCRRRRR